jgi:hypothetical protein
MRIVKEGMRTLVSNDGIRRVSTRERIARMSSMQKYMSPEYKSYQKVSRIGFIVLPLQVRNIICMTFVQPRMRSA